MTVDTALATLSDRLFVATVIVYALAMLAYAAEAAASSRPRSLRSDAVAVPQRLLVGAGAPVPPAGGPTPAAPSIAPRPWGDRVGRAAVALTVLGWGLHVTSLTVRGFAEDRIPWGNMYEFASAGALAVISAYLVLLVREKVRWLGLVVTFAAVLALGLAGTVLYTTAGPVVPALNSYWLQIHVTAAVISAGLLTIGSASAGLYLLRLRYDARVAAGRPPGYAGLARLVPEAGALDRVAHRVITFAFPIWTFAIIAGAIWAEAAWGRYWGWDPKETWAFITWVIYAGYLHARSTAGWRGKRAAWIGVIGFLAFLFNFFGVNIAIVGLHSYAGI